ncbi:Protein bric-a-brac 1 [Armadillidium vulgare]|nr:Protein bric-a-brac 1 [Armadillidium vulgare]
MDAERFLLKWNNHQSNLVTVFDQLYEQEAFTDVTLACDGRSFAAHKVILSACSPYFQQLFLSNPCKHPIIFMRDVRASDLDALLAFMYRGEINVHQQDLASFLKTAESLQIKGLSDSSDKPRDTSKILEAMEKKFSSSTSSGVSSSSLGPMGAISSLLSNSLSRSSPVSSVVSPISSAAGMNALSRSFMSHVNANHALESSGPPEKKFKPSQPTQEEFTRILPKIKNLVSSQSLMSPVPGLITPITLAATVMKSGSHHPPSLPLPYLSNLENNNSLTSNADSSSSTKEKKKHSLN